MINVTQSYIPPIEEYISYVKQAFSEKWLTNRGKLTVELEKRLKDFLSIENITLTTNGTLPIQIAIKALGLKGEIITTPFSYIATTSAIIWEKCNPIFVDIDEQYLTIDPQKIELAITEKTSAILATHVYGNPCDVVAIERIAKKYNLKVIYDAAHCFGVEYKNKSIFSYGDVSTCSFHATKIFHTGEGGCFITKDNELHQKLYNHHNFGHNGPTQYHSLGVNAKISELQAAMGLSVLNHIESIFSARKDAVNQYINLLEDNANIHLLNIRPETKWNFHYFPIIFKTEKDLLRVVDNLNAENIFPRRYFYPSLNTIPYIKSKQRMPISEKIATRVLCLPLSSELKEHEIEKICKIVNL